MDILSSKGQTRRRLRRAFRLCLEGTCPPYRLARHECRHSTQGCRDGVSEAWRMGRLHETGLNFDCSTLGSTAPCTWSAIAACCCSEEHLWAFGAYICRRAAPAPAPTLALTVEPGMFHFLGALLLDSFHLLYVCEHRLLIRICICSMELVGMYRFN